MKKPTSEQYRNSIYQSFPKKSLSKCSPIQSRFQAMAFFGSIRFCEKRCSKTQDCCVKSVSKPNQKNPSHGDVEISSSCNGLLLIWIHDDLLLWNPLTRCSKKVLGYENLHDDSYHIAYGLCFDSLSNEYKGVMALSHQTPSHGGEFAVVGNFRSKTWTEVHFPYRFSSVNSRPVLNENLH
ncbi:hypothetical protein ACSBR2_013432 [Camellia fascicularis]